jgi:isoleucyl-tRNA synthetase
MPLFEKVETQTDFPALERGVLDLWERTGAFEKLKAKNAGKPVWSFLDGPITANNPMGVHHAWNRTYKDAYNRYFAMTGHELRYQQGFDCQGLWVEVEVEKELKLQSKRDIESLVPGDKDASLAKFVQACKDRVNKYARIQTDQSIRLGYWMDWDRTDDDWAKSPDDRKSYFTMASENNYTIWSFLKKCHHRNLIYRGYDAMPWCGRCGSGISEQEKAEGYKLIEHRSVFVKFPLKDKPGENLLAWTTTPWTLSSNVAAAVNPKLTYLKVKVKNEIYYVAKGAFKYNRMDASTTEGDEEPTAKKGKREWLDGVPHLKSIEQMFKEKGSKEGFEIVGEILGKEMIGWAYEGPFDHVPAQQAPYGYPEEVAIVVKQLKWAPEVCGRESHRVIPWDDVGETEGTGIVHIAPGCGQSDFFLGKEHGLPPVAPLDDMGLFHEGFAQLAGLNAVDPKTADVVFDHLKATEKLFAVERYVHKYPHCWRCKNELLFRLVDEWFIDMKWRQEIMDVVRKVTFLPESVNGQARELDWLKNMGDWMISKKRYWGLALPIWVDERDSTQFEVIGSFEELKERAVEGWAEFEGKTPHRPYIDKIKIRNPKTGNLMSRVGDVGNPWLDAGIVAFSTMKYNTDRAYWEKWYPADFITESFPGQFRNWFYALLALSTMMSDGQPPFKTLLGFATVTDQFGKAMHKSDGNSIEFIGAANEGYELFADIAPDADAKVALKDLPKGSLAVREEATVNKEKQPIKRVFAKYKPIGADVVRWLYCRQNPSSNVKFGPEPTDEVRAKFVLKLWNCYAFLTNYARLDGFDPATHTVPLADRPDIDRWVISELQGLIGTAHSAFKAYGVMEFCLAAERFVDDKLSNWYVRRNRDRFQSNVAELDAGGLRDKWAAHSTLYDVMLTLSKLFAPIVPFLTEAIFQNLRGAADPVSIHLCDYPVADSTLVDATLSADMNALLDLVSLGGAARNVAKQNFRQPLAEIRIQCGDDASKRAAKRFSVMIAEELNVKLVTVHDDANGPMLKASAKLNKKTAAAKLGPKLKEAEAELLKWDATKIPEATKAGTFALAGIPLDAGDVAIDFTAPEGFAGVADRGTQLMVDSRITDALKGEGLARNVIRQIQEARKNADLNMEDRIALYLHGDTPALAAAIATHRDTIAADTLTTQWLTSPEGAESEVKIEGAGLKIALRKVS